MGANEISNRAAAQCYVKMGGPGTPPPNIGDPGMFTMRSNSGFEDSVLVVLPPGITPADTLEEAGGQIGLALERPIARNQLCFTVQTVTGAEASDTDPVLYGQEPMGIVLCFPVLKAAFLAYLAGTGPDPTQAPTDGSSFDPIDMLAITYDASSSNGTDLLVTVWELPAKDGALPPTFISFPP